MIYYNFSLDQDWKADKVRWRHNGHHTFPHTGIKAQYFVTITGKKDALTKKYKQNKALKKKVYSHEDYPDLYYIRYVGDETVINDFFHQNSKREAKKEVDYLRTNPKVINEIKQATGNPLKIYGEMKNKFEGDCDE